MAWALVHGVITRFGERICEIAVLGGRRKGTDGARIRRCVNSLQQGHVGNIIKVNAILENDTKTLAVQADGEDSRREA
ncbi:hypothetical protein RRF57_010729 [Xylaria bambusicola]|uniref:Uncharacterized protein n=1 Tax=Xylaria bambusicola TaxID=326684 RepID=A0AAN7Z9P4_9PEZI